MDAPIQAVSLTRKPGGPLAPTAPFGLERARTAQRFHASFPQYAPTPLASLNRLAAHLGVAAIHVKDESRRFSLNAFKVLGGSYAIGRYIARELGLAPEDLTFSLLTSPHVRDRLGQLTFATATDGNHGRGVAWTAAQLGHRSVVRMPKGSSPERLANIRALGADASVTDLNYDDTVRLVQRLAQEQGWVVIQDTAWEGYWDIPAWIMEGYTTMALEAVRQLEDRPPSHLFLQAGVGAMAGSLTAFFADFYGQDRPKVVIVEPHRANCLFRTAQANDGQLHRVDGALDTIMAGLACGEPCSISWDILRDHADHFLSVPDYVAAQGMRVLGAPLPGDPQVISGESGAATLGLVTEVLRRKDLAPLKEALGLGKASRILCFSTEGDTDRENYRNILWDGLWPHPSK